jgi:proteic killer suppression protein
MILSFADDTTRRVWNLEVAPRLGRDVQRAAHKRLQMLDVARSLRDLRVPPGNRLEKLSGERRGQHSIRVNDQYRICFVWTDNGPTGVEITDHH